MCDPQTSTHMFPSPHTRVPQPTHVCDPQPTHTCSPAPTHVFPIPHIRVIHSPHACVPQPTHTHVFPSPHTRDPVHTHTRDPQPAHTCVAQVCVSTLIEALAGERKVHFDPCGMCANLVQGLGTSLCWNLGKLGGVGGTVAQRVVLLPHSTRDPASIPISGTVCLCGVCTFSL